jgi:hypothetical protein
LASSSEPSRKRGGEEDDEDESHHPRLIKEGIALAPEEPEEVAPPPTEEPEEVSLPPPEEAPPPVEAAPTLALTAEEASWAINLFREAFNKLRGVAVHLGVLGPNDLLERTMKDFAFKIHIVVRDLERSVLGLVDDDGGLDGFGSDYDDGAPPTATSSA